MPVGLPDDFVITRRRVEIGHGRPVRERGAAVMDGVRVPVGRAPEHDVAIAEEIVTPFHDSIGARPRRTGRVGEARVDMARQLGAHAGAQRPGRGPRAKVLALGNLVQDLRNQATGSLSEQRPINREHLAHVGNRIAG